MTWSSRYTAAPSGNRQQHSSDDHDGALRTATSRGRSVPAGPGYTCVRKLQHPLGLAHLAVDEQADERAEVALAVDAAPPSRGRDSQRRTCASSSLDTGLSSTITATRSARPAGSARPRPAAAASAVEARAARRRVSCRDTPAAPPSRDSSDDVHLVPQVVGDAHRLHRQRLGARGALAHQVRARHHRGRQAAVELAAERVVDQIEEVAATATAARCRWRSGPAAPAGGGLAPRAHAPEQHSSG